MFTEMKEELIIKMKVAMLLRGVNGKYVASQLGCSSQNFYARMKNKSFSESQFEKIFEILNCSVKVDFKTTVIMNDNEREIIQ